MRYLLLFGFLYGFVPCDFVRADHLNFPALEKDLDTLTRRFEGRVGTCVQSKGELVCVRGGERFSLQSVVKLMAGFAVMEAVDQRGWRLDEQVILHNADRSEGGPLAQLIGDAGFRTSIGDLVRRAIIDSDSTAIDYLFGKLGGPPAVQSALERKKLAGIRVDRDERHLQTEIVGLKWRPEYADGSVLEKATKALSEAERDRAYREYAADDRDTATPRGMTEFLTRLIRGELLSATSTSFLLQAMKECATGPDRLKAGVPAGWELAHKTGTSGSWKGLTVATNDVGVLTDSSGQRISIAVFVADSRASSAERAALIAKIAAATAADYR